MKLRPLAGAPERRAIRQAIAQRRAVGPLAPRDRARHRPADGDRNLMQLESTSSGGRPPCPNPDRHPLWGYLAGLPGRGFPNAVPTQTRETNPSSPSSDP